METVRICTARGFYFIKHWMILKGGNLRIPRLKLPPREWEIFSIILKYFYTPPVVPAAGDSNTSIISKDLVCHDDSYRSQFLYAKPILDQYGFKASLFEVCTWVGKTSDVQAWQDIAALQRDGMDIESHTMTHAHLPLLISSPSRLD